MFRRHLINSFLILIALFLLINSINAQIDIETFTPAPSERPSSQSTAPEVTPQRLPQNSEQNISLQETSSCANYYLLTNNRLRDQFRVGDIIVGHTGGQGGDFYAVSANDNLLKAKQLFNEIDRIINRAGILQDPEGYSGEVGVSRYVEGVLRHSLRSKGDIKNELLRGSLPSLSQIHDQCAVRITGTTPSIFIYSPNTKVQPSVPILYLEQTDQYLYYEYDSTNISFNKPKHGWIIDKGNLSEFVNEISGELKLTPLEKERLYFELNFSASDVKSDKLFIGLIPQKDIDKNIPLKTILPINPKVIRYHFYISSANGESKIIPPVLTSIQRSLPLILELGSFSGK